MFTKDAKKLAQNTYAGVESCNARASWREAEEMPKRLERLAIKGRAIELGQAGATLAHFYHRFRAQV